MEIEIPYVSNHLESSLEFLAHNLHDDGSLRFTNYFVDDLPIVTRNQELLVHRSGFGAQGMGLEIVTSVYEADELLPILIRLRDLIQHIPTHPRASVHIHMDVTEKPWIFVKSLCLCFYHLEAVLYRLSACGEKHRGELSFNGEYQDHKYARPLSAPIATQFRGRTKPLIDMKHLVGSKTATEFLASWGRLDITSGHYIAQRLHGINICPVVYQGSVELRIFNGCYRFLPEMLLIAQTLYDLAGKGDPLDMPLLLGGEYDVTAKDVCEIFNADLTSMWGKHWLRPIQDRNKLSHYRENTLVSGEIEPYRNNRREIDDGSEDFVLYRSR